MLVWMRWIKGRPLQDEVSLASFFSSQVWWFGHVFFIFLIRRHSIDGLPKFILVGKSRSSTNSFVFGVCGTNVVWIMAVMAGRGRDLW